MVKELVKDLCVRQRVSHVHRPLRQTVNGIKTPSIHKNERRVPLRGTVNVMATYVLVITRCDNKLVVTVNGEEIFNKYFDFNPALNERVDFTSRLQGRGFENKIVVSGYNGPTPISPRTNRPRANPYAFHYQILKDGAEIYAGNMASPDPNARGGTEGLIFSTTHPIVLD
jgi:hypothetical protein